MKARMPNGITDCWRTTWLRQRHEFDETTILMMIFMMMII
jgi:hypothetical protein